MTFFYRYIGALVCFFYMCPKIAQDCPISDQMSCCSLCNKTKDKEQSYFQVHMDSSIEQIS